MGACVSSDSRVKSLIKGASEFHGRGVLHANANSDLLEDSERLQKAIADYPTVILEVLSGRLKIDSAPMDVVWVWYAHAMMPNEFYKDLSAAFPAALKLKSTTPGTGQLVPSVDLLKATTRLRTFVTSVAAYIPMFQTANYMDIRTREYLMFLKFAAAQGSVPLMPTVEIDFVWHTHMWCYWNYHSDISELCNQRPLMHDHHDLADNDAETRLHEMKVAWKTMFRVPYDNSASGITALRRKAAAAQLGKTISSQATRHIELMQFVLSNPDYTNPGSAVLIAAIDNYKALMSSSNEESAAALYASSRDAIDWVHHVHMLHPHNYRQDCMTYFGQVVSSPCSPTVKRVAAGFAPSVDLHQACFRQRKFAESIQPSLSKFTNAAYARHCVQEYQKFLEFAGRHRDMNCVPSLQMDFCWHTHMRVPDQYHNDTVSIVGMFMDHNDDIPDEKLAVDLTEMKKKWLEDYNTEFGFMGVKLLRAMGKTALQKPNRYTLDTSCSSWASGATLWPVAVAACGTSVSDVAASCGTTVSSCGSGSDDKGGTGGAACGSASCGSKCGATAPTCSSTCTGGSCGSKCASTCTAAPSSCAAASCGSSGGASSCGSSGGASCGSSGGSSCGSSGGSSCGSSCGSS
eukprot:TRINITY_DN5095_c0_g1_i2.p1 TRINITY_DN5095_c0_g1~~TRINITY_DN5095_c0_g1_i2.p1  ORF type:complete len:630 (-),score=117.05 TRINITY_DN5095_c0_g1_i2:43-1932(-)